MALGLREFYAPPWKQSGKHGIPERAAFAARSFRVSSAISFGLAAQGLGPSEFLNVGTVDPPRKFGVPG